MDLSHYFSSMNNIYKVQMEVIYVAEEAMGRRRKKPYADHSFIIFLILILLVVSVIH